MGWAERRGLVARNIGRVVELIAERLTAGEMSHNADDLVFTNGVGAPVDPGRARREFLQICKQARLGPNWSPVDLRHTCASSMSAAGVAIETVSDLLGHRDTRMASRRRPPHSVSLRVQFHPFASLEVSDAARWYDDQRPGLGDRYLTAVSAAVERASRWPNSRPPTKTQQGCSGPLGWDGLVSSRDRGHRDPRNAGSP